MNQNNKDSDFLLTPSKKEIMVISHKKNGQILE